MGEGFCANLIEIKRLSIILAKEKRHWDDQTLCFIEQSLANMLDNQGRGFTSMEAKYHIIELEEQRSNILREREET